MAANLLNQDFNPVGKNEIWAGNVTKLKTAQGWIYLAIVMDLYSPRFVGWHLDKRITTGLICKVLIKAYNLRSHPRGWSSIVIVNLSTPVSAFGKFLKGYGLRAGMGDVGLAGIMQL